MSKSILLLALMFFSCSSGAFGQNVAVQGAPSKEQLTSELRSEYQDKLRGTRLTPSAKSLLESMVSQAANTYAVSPSADNYEKAKKGFASLLDTAKGRAVIKKGVHQTIEINSNNIESAKMSLCPLYPFC